MFPSGSARSRGFGSQLSGSGITTINNGRDFYNLNFGNPGAYNVTLRGDMHGYTAQQHQQAYFRSGAAEQRSVGTMTRASLSCSPLSYHQPPSPPAIGNVEIQCQEVLMPNREHCRVNTTPRPYHQPLPSPTFVNVGVQEVSMPNRPRCCVDPIPRRPSYPGTPLLNDSLASSWSAHATPGSIRSRLEDFPEEDDSYASYNGSPHSVSFPTPNRDLNQPWRPSSTTF